MRYNEERRQTLITLSLFRLIIGYEQQRLAMLISNTTSHQRLIQQDVLDLEISNTTGTSQINTTDHEAEFPGVRLRLQFV